MLVVYFTCSCSLDKQSCTIGHTVLPASLSMSVVDKLIFYKVYMYMPIILMKLHANAARKYVICLLYIFSSNCSIMMAHCTHTEYSYSCMHLWHVSISQVPWNLIIQLHCMLMVHYTLWFLSSIYSLTQHEQKSLGAIIATLMVWIVLCRCRSP